MIEFTEQHVGLKVWNPRLGNGEITEYTDDPDYPVRVSFYCCATSSYNPNGFSQKNDAYRTLFVGHDLEMTVNEQPLPEPEPVCPFCGVVHELIKDIPDFLIIGAKDMKQYCPLSFVYFASNGHYKATIERIKEHMKNDTK